MDITRISLEAGFHNREVSNEEMRLLLCAKNSGKQREEESAIITKSSKREVIRTTPCHLPRFSSFLFQTNTPSTSQSPIFKTFNSKPNFPPSKPPRHPHQHTATSSRHTVTVGTCRRDRHLREPDTCPQRIHRATYPHLRPHFPLPLFISHLVMLKSVLDPQSRPIQSSLCRNDIASALLPSVPRVVIIGSLFEG